jgi:RNA polymerase sigma factor (sigma-70 family)
MTTSTALPLIDTARRRLENQLYRQVYPLFEDYYSAKLRKHTLAKELALEAMGKVMTKLDGYDQTQPLQNWAMRVARNHLFDYYRQRASHKHQFVQPLGGLQVEDEQDGRTTRWFDDYAQTEAEQEYQLLEAELLLELREWPGQEGEVVRRHLLLGEEEAFIAQHLTLKTKHVKRIVSEAKQKIRTRLLAAVLD